MVTPKQSTMVTLDHMCNTIATVGATLAPWKCGDCVHTVEHRSIRYNGSGGSTVYASVYAYPWQRGDADVIQLFCKQRKASYAITIRLPRVPHMRKFEPTGLLNHDVPTGAIW